MTTGRRTARRPGVRRQLKWSEQDLNSSMVSGSVLLDRLNATLTTAQREEATVVRNILCLRFTATVAAGSSSDAMLVSIGLGVTSEQAFVTGSAAVSAPSDALQEPVQGWLYRCRAWVFGGPESSPMASWLLNEDIRTSRKIGAGVPFVRIDNDPGAGSAFTMRVVGSLRSLYLLA